MKDLRDEMLSKLAEIEAEMKRINFYFKSNSEGQGSFEHWLQFTFLPNATKAVNDNQVPSHSQVGLMALRQYDYHSTVEKALPLMNLLFDFDKLVEKFKLILK